MRSGSRRRGVYRLVAALVMILLLGVGATQARRHWPGDVRSG